MSRAPGALRFLIFEEPTVGVVDTAMQAQFGRTRLQFRQREFRQQCDRVMIQFAPARRIQVEEQVYGIVIPTPPQIPSQSPEPLLGRSNETVERPCFADHRRDLGSRFGEHANLIGRKDAGFDCLYDQDTL